MKVEDIVYIKDPLLKPQKYPLGKVLEAFENELNEVTQVKILKGNSGEIVKHHVESLIPLFTDDQMQAKDKTNQDEVSNIENFKANEECSLRPKRKAAIKSEALTKQWIDDGLV